MVIIVKQVISKPEMWSYYSSLNRARWFSWTKLLNRILTFTFNRSPVLLFQQIVIEKQINQLLQREMVYVCRRMKDDVLHTPKQNAATSLCSCRKTWVLCTVVQSVPISPQPSSLEGDQLVSDPLSGALWNKSTGLWHSDSHRVCMDVKLCCCMKLLFFFFS